MPRDKTLITSLTLLAVLVVALVAVSRVTIVPEKDTQKVEGYAKIVVAPGQNTNDPNTEHISILLSTPNNQPLVVTGWKIKGNKYNLSLGRASSLPKQGEVNEEVPIVITKPSTLIVSTGHSPIGVSFRENKCSGILGYYQTYTPPLTPSCSDCLGDPSTLLGASKYPEYNLCVEAHKTDADFFLNTWRLYVGTDTELWRNSLEVLHLYDQDGKLIALESL